LAVKVFLEEGEKSFRKGFGRRRFEMSVFEDVVEEFVGKGGEVIDSRGRLFRRGDSARRDHRESESAHSI